MKTGLLDKIVLEPLSHSYNIEPAANLPNVLCTEENNLALLGTCNGAVSVFIYLLNSALN